MSQPYSHKAIVIPAGAPVAHAVRVADEERSHVLFDAKVDDLPRGFVPQVADAPLGPTTDRVLRPLELLPAPGVLLAKALLLGDLPELPASLPLETANAAPGDNERRASVGSHSGQVDFPQVNGRQRRAGGLTRLWHIHADMQLEASVPD